MNINQELTLNLSADGIPPRLHMVQGDANTRTVVATLWDGAQPYTVPAASAVMIRFRKPDGTGGLYDTTESGAQVTVSGNTVTAPVATQMLAVAGVVQAQVDIYGTATGKAAEKLATFRFAVEVAPSVYPDAEIISSDYFNIIAADIGKAVEAAARAEAAQAAASAAQQGAETARDDAVNAKTAAESAKTAAVAAQKKSEQAQTSAEAAQTAAGQSAAAAQTAREGAEAAQSGAQAAQTAAESAKAAAQAAQTGAESARAGAETARGAAEDSAEDAEAWAVGQRNGVDVPSTDPAYHNNAKYYKDQAQTIAGGEFVSYGAPQSLTAEQQAQARENINAPAPYEAGDNISITGRIITTKAFPCNPKLTDNWYWGNLVDQRNGYTVPPGKNIYKDGTLLGTTDKYYTVIGFTGGDNNPQFVYNGNVCYSDPNTAVRGYTGTGYTIDRWKLDNDSGACSINLTKEGIEFIATSGATGIASLNQIIDPSDFNALSGRTVTLSLLGKTDTTQQVLFYVNGQIAASKSSEATNGMHMTSLTYTFPDSISFAAVFVYGRSTPGIGTGKILASKLELGTQQTLAHKEYGDWVLNEIPKFGDQLAECQRYCVAFNKYDSFLPVDNNDFVVELPVPMRAMPTIINPQNIVNANVTNPTVAWYNIGSNQLRLRSSAAHGGLQAVCDGPVLFSADL